MIFLFEDLEQVQCRSYNLTTSSIANCRTLEYSVDDLEKLFCKIAKWPCCSFLLLTKKTQSRYHKVAISNFFLTHLTAILTAAELCSVC